MREAFLAVSLMVPRRRVVLAPAGPPPYRLTMNGSRTGRAATIAPAATCRSVRLPPFLSTRQLGRGLATSSRPAINRLPAGKKATMTYHPDKIAFVIQEAAEAAGISERQLRRAMAAGELH